MPPDREALPRLSTTMMMALGEMPVRLRNYGGAGYFLPTFAPSGQTLKALERRGLVEIDFRDRMWKRTALGESVWSAR